MVRNCLSIAVASLLLAAVAGCQSHDAKPADPTTQPIAASGTPVNKYCPVNPKDPIDPKVTYTYNGKTYGFCCPDCIADFKKDPEKYAASAK
jgi:YHS domain-containing protein